MRRFGPGWRSYTISCSTCAERSACSSSCARCGPRPTSSRRSTTRRGPRDGSPAARPQLVPAAAASPRRGRSGAPAAAVSGRDRVVRPVGLRPGRLQLLGVGARGPLRRALGPRQLLPQPVPVRLERSRRARSHAARNPATRAFLRGAFRRWRQWDWIAAQRTDRYVANSPHHPGADPRLLRARGRESSIRRSRPPGSRRDASRPLRDRLRADVAQADRRRDRGLQPAPACR